MLCTVSPAGLEEFFAQVGDEVATRTSPAPEIDQDTRLASLKKGAELAALYRVDLMLPNVS